MVGSFSQFEQSNSAYRLLICGELAFFKNEIRIELRTLLEHVKIGLSYSNSVQSNTEEIQLPSRNNVRVATLKPVAQQCSHIPEVTIWKVVIDQ